MKRKVLVAIMVILATLLLVSVAFAADRTAEARSMLNMINEFRTGSDAWYWNKDNTTWTTVTGLKKLERDGYITRAAHPEDNRYNTIRVTEKGLAIVKKSCESFDRIDRAMFDGLTEEELAVYERLLDKLQSNLSAFLK